MFIAIMEIGCISEVLGMTQEAENWLNQFLEFRFADFGMYEDSIVGGEHFLHHSVLSPLLNIGLLTADRVLKKAIDHA